MKETTRAIYESLFRRAPELQPCREAIESSFALLDRCYTTGGKVLTCGNGGSAADAEHIVGELMKGFRMKRPLTEPQREAFRTHFPDDSDAIAGRLQRALPAISLVSQSSLSTAVANDLSAEMVFAQQVFGYGRPGDVLIAISTSGRAANVLNAVKTALSFGLATIGLTGKRESPLAELSTVAIRAPGAETSEIQEHHLAVYHTLCAMVEAELFDQ